MNEIIKFIKRDKTERAIKTFIETFSSYIAINVITTDLSSIDTIKGLIVGATASAISVVINSFKNSDEITKDDYEEDDF